VSTIGTIFFHLKSSSNADVERREECPKTPVIDMQKVLQPIVELVVLSHPASVPTFLRMNSETFEVRKDRDHRFCVAVILEQVPVGTLIEENSIVEP
jgi:hypothetical protein